jgi:hypothetical protein
MSSESKTWNLEAFLDSLILELDKAQDTLSIKGVNRPLTYTVKDVALELQIFPHFDGKRVQFSTAKSGESGASKITFQLGSITDRQIREITKNPITKDDVPIEMIESIDEETRDELQKMGVTTNKDLERMELKNIDLQKVSKKKIDYGSLANLINQARRRELAPKVNNVSAAKSAEGVILSLRGENLALAQGAAAGAGAGGGRKFPIAVLNDEEVEIVSASGEELQIAVRGGQLSGRSNQLKIALDPYSVVQMNLNV